MTPAVIVLMSPATYRGGAFSDAASRLGLSLIRVLDLPRELADQWQVALAVDFGDTAAAVERLVGYVCDEKTVEIRAIIALDDRGAMIAAEASAHLGLAHNDPQSALAARDKHLMRDRLLAGGVPVPAFRAIPASPVPSALQDGLGYPVVVKPTLLSGSRGVIRANDEPEFIVAFARTRNVLVAAGIDPAASEILIEQFVPGFEVALEGLLTNGQLQTLTLFDKPDPLDGPYFEETIYLTPSRLPEEIQRKISRRTAEAAQAIGLRHGPVHAEFRIDLERGDIWTIELAGRSIGGLCASVLEFGSGVSLEELILRHAIGETSTLAPRSAGAAGVMMIPIPRGGILRRVDGIDVAGQVEGVTGIEITAPLNQPIVPLPEGESYLGFIFARGVDPESVDTSLREAHACLTFRIDPTLTLRSA